ncbi:hypothetical protein PR202_ga20130 [Eleusine coracana subsp. coracana]|uniref:Major facilitator superfamily (MFS) profile domain-containing protein n=1 Tax=Eleusine coracana subsp. coracana TaxID=191504 RepID=A0AAV5CXD9_ELECO|nr:hypothetical protein PR202_ga20130 [Eleusine coracana subsp. coracana]
MKASSCMEMLAAMHRVLTFGICPLVFRTVGFGSNAALMGAVVLGAVKLGVPPALHRRHRPVRTTQGALHVHGGRRPVDHLLGRDRLDHGRTSRRGGDGEVVHAVAELVFTCLDSAGFGWSWGPLGWVVQSEIFPVEVRSAGQAMNASIGLGLSFVQTQSFLAMLCRFKYFTFAFYAAWVAVMTVFIALFLPETKGVPLESMSTVWACHWYWKRFVHAQNTC